MADSCTYSESSRLILRTRLRRWCAELGLTIWAAAFGSLLGVALGFGFGLGAAGAFALQLGQPRCFLLLLSPSTKPAGINRDIDLRAHGV